MSQQNLIVAVYGMFFGLNGFLFVCLFVMHYELWGNYMHMLLNNVQIIWIFHRWIPVKFFKFLSQDNQKKQDATEFNLECLSQGSEWVYLSKWETSVFNNKFAKIKKSMI